MDGRRPGAGSFDLRTLLRDLHRTGAIAPRWLSVKVNDVTEGGEQIAAESARYLRQVVAAL